MYGTTRGSVNMMLYEHAVQHVPAVRIVFNHKLRALRFAERELEFAVRGQVRVCEILNRGLSSGFAPFLDRISSPFECKYIPVVLCVTMVVSTMHHSSHHRNRFHVSAACQCVIRSRTVFSLQDQNLVVQCDAETRVLAADGLYSSVRRAMESYYGDFLSTFEMWSTQHRVLFSKPGRRAPQGLDAGVHYIFSGCYAAVIRREDGKEQVSLDPRI